MSLSPGTRLGPYEILSPLGAGGMGEVYRARHVKLDREAAVKVLPSEVASDPERLRRFEREARAASGLSHQAIVTIYDIDEHEGTTYIAMELVDGVTLREWMAEATFDTGGAIRVARMIAEGLATAHAAGIIHRDLKPDNVMITRDGQVKILDFGLAKQLPTGVDVTAALTTMSMETDSGVVLGTVPYMSPEQAGGRPVDHLSDQFSFGAVLYEMVCGRRPFEGDSVGTVLSAILRDAPAPPRSLRPDIPRRVEEVVHRCLEKDSGKRFHSTDDLLEALRRCEAGSAGGRSGLTLGRRAIAAVIAILAVGAATAGWVWLRDDVVRWMERDTLAEINRLTESGELYQAYRLARGLLGKIPDDPEVRGMLDRITLPVSIVTDPPGATVRLSEYGSVDAPWVDLGETPMQGVRVPYALARWEISKEGFETFEGAPFGVRPFMAFALGLRLETEGSRPDGMVWVPGGPYERLGFPVVNLADYWLDRYEVTNRQYKEFLDIGGYETEEYWNELFAETNDELPQAEAMARLVDRTGRPGPAGWEFGSYEASQADFPVGGVSWYEAAAYCRWVGKDLPTLFHWSAASAHDQLSDIVRVSNFGRDGPAEVGSHQGLGDFGTFDLAGNVKEWCWNEAPSGRYILGGAWGEPTYTFKMDADAQAPMTREARHGFRCARYDRAIEEELLIPLVPSYAVIASEEPANDEIFEAYRGIYAYDDAVLEAALDAVDESSHHWRKETVSFAAAYGGERIIAHLFLPRNATPPYQPVIWFPGNDVFFMPAGDALASPYLYDFIPRSGRALIYPVYKGTYERYVPFAFAPNEWRDMIVMWSKDVSRTVDYLEERPDIDADNIGYYGFSSGAHYGPLFTAVDPRFKASVLLAGGLLGDIPPEAAPFNFAPRSHVPTLMINGRDDFLHPFETSQRPFFNYLGAPADDKRHARLEGGHIPPDRVAIIEEVVGWFDRYLGPVESSIGSVD